MTIQDAQFAKGDTLTVTVDTLATGGKALTRLNGLVIFIDRGLPGQTVEITITKKKKRFAEAVCNKVVHEISDQIPPRCKHFGVCGGCLWQNMPYDAQLDWKKQFVSDSLNRIAGAQDIEIQNTLPSPDTYFYRNKMEFAFGENASGITVGLRRYGSHEVIDLQECFLQTERTAQLIDIIRTFVNSVPALSAYNASNRRGYLRFLVIRETRHTKQCMVQLITARDTTNDEQLDNAMRQLGQLLQEKEGVTAFVHSRRTHTAQIAYGEKSLCVLGQETLTEMLNFENDLQPVTLTMHSSGFFQVNTDATARLYGTAIDMAELTGAETVWDVYCGVGGIGLAASRNAKEVFGVEITPQAVKSAQENATINNISNARFTSGDALEILSEEQSAPDVVFTDPPRAGMAPELVDLLIKRAPERIIYISCDPATQARDVGLLSSHYSVAAVQPVDLFPQTAHIENIIRLDKI